MPDALTVYLHFPCFDGVVSAVLASEYLERKHGWKTQQIVQVTYAERETWAAQTLAKPAAVVDFLFHPDADFWADHHQTTFLTPELEARYTQDKSGSLLYDPEASSCAEVIWRKSYRLLREPRFREMVEWAHRIDGARYDSVEEAVLGDAPALRINFSFLRDSSSEFCSFLVESLRMKSLAEVADSPRVADHYKSVRKAIQSGQRLFRKASHMEKDGIVVFDVQQAGNAVLSRYAPYLAFPKARYSVGIMESDDGAKITAMRNPWRRFKSVPLGQIFSRYGGGGHQRVASVLLKDAQEAKRTLGSILNDLRNAASVSKGMPKEALSGD
ncbi:MAG: hypothetical protein ABR987_05400 [Terracidiphilus sp.]|jgi:hypothetical protein